MSLGGTFQQVRSWDEEKSLQISRHPSHRICFQLSTRKVLHNELTIMKVGYSDPPPRLKVTEGTKSKKMQKKLKIKIGTLGKARSQAQIKVDRDQMVESLLTCCTAHYPTPSH